MGDSLGAKHLTLDQKNWVRISVPELNGHMKDDIDTPHALSHHDDARSRALVLLVLLLSIGIIYGSTLAKNHSEAEDSLNYLTITRDGSLTRLFHPHHLLFHIVNRGVYLLWGSMGFRGSPELPMELNDVAAGLVGLALVYALARRIGLSFHLSLACMVAVAASFGYWWYSVEVETYLLPVPFILLSAYQFIALAESRFEKKRFVGLGLTLALGTLFHQQHVLLIPVMLLSVLIMWRRRRPDIAVSTVRNGVVTMLVTSGALIIMPYLLAATMVHGYRDFSSILDWTRSYQRIGLYTPWSLSSPIKSLAGIGRSIWGLHFIFKFTWFQRLSALAFPDKSLLEEQFLADHMSMIRVWFSLFALGLGVLSATGLLMRSILHSPKRAPGAQRSGAQAAFMALTLPLLLAYSVFNTLWEPQNIEFWVALLPFLFLVLVVWIVRSQWDRTGRTLTWVFVASMAICNLAGSVLPQTNLDGDFRYQADRYLIDNTRAGDLIVMDGSYLSLYTLKFYSEATVLSAADFGPDILLSKIQEHRGGRVLISSRVFDPLPQTKNELEHINDILPDGHLRTQLADRLRAVHTNFYQTIWVYQF